MKQILITLFSVLICASAGAQSLTEMEYFYDEVGKPGTGQKLSISGEIDGNYTLNAPDESGLHTLYVRVKDDQNQWSHYTSQSVFVGDGGGMSRITSLEYFYDEIGEPGTGQEIVINSDVNGNFTLNPPDDPGLHTLYIRIKDDQNQWSHYTKLPVFVRGGGGVSQITLLEYFVDEDPGVGKATPIEINASQPLDSTVIMPVSIVDILQLNSQTSGFRVKDNANGWSHTMKLEIDSCTVLKSRANFETVRFGNTISFSNQSSNAQDTYKWNFDDGSTSDLSNPVHEFVPGEYDVELISGKGCRIDTIQKHITIEGVEYYEPKNVAQGSEFHLRIFGGALNEAAQVRLIGSSTITPIEFRTPAGSELNAYFALGDAAVGKYDVEIIHENGDRFFYEDGFEIEQPDEFDIQIDLEGPGIVRTLREEDYAIVIKNPTNLHIGGLEIICGIPERMETSFDTEIEKIRQNTKEAVDPDNEFSQEEFDAIFDELIDIEAETIGGVPNKNKKTTTLFVPSIEPHSTFKIPFKGEFSGPSSEPCVTITYVSAPRQIGRSAAPTSSNNNPTTADNVHDIAMVLSGGLKALPHPAAKAVGQTADEIDLVSKILFQKYFDWKYGVNSFDKKFINDLAVNYATAKATEGLSGLGKKGLAKIDLNSSKIVGNVSKKYNKALLDLNSKRTGSSKLSEQVFEKIIKTLGENPGENIALQYLNEIMGSAAKAYIDKQIAGEIINQLEDKRNTYISPETDCHEITVVRSYDPNMIMGPKGIGEARYIKDQSIANYKVLFENKASATAPAQLVTITDTLDTAAYDLKTFQFENINISGKNFDVEANRKEYFMEIDLTQTRGLNVRVNMKLDTISGVAKWSFLSLDPETSDLTNDVLAGFLPPNNEQGHGEGFVSYSVQLKALAHNHEIKNKAEIVFDQNETLITNTWSNKIDLGNPTAEIGDITELEENKIALELKGADAESGIASYFFYYKQLGDNEFTAAGATGKTNSVEFTRKPDTAYEFYTVSEDFFGNLSSPSAIATFDPNGGLSLNEAARDNTLLISPNPTKNTLYLKWGKGINPKSVTIIDVQGRAIMSFPFAVKSLDMATLQSGVYFCIVETPKGRISKKIIKR